MKLENLIVQYLYKNKSMRLQDIGTFTISPDVHIPAESERELVLPNDAIRFEYDPRAKEDEGLIDYIVEHTRKIKPLATSDLESFSNLNRQFINIGKPLVLEGIGEISKNNRGEYEFSQGRSFNTRVEAAPVQIREKEQAEVVFGDERPKKANRSGLWLVLGILFLGALGAILYYYFNDSDNTSATSLNTTDTTTTTPTATNTDTVVSIPVTPSVNANAFGVSLKNFSTRAAAESYKSKLESYGHKLELKSAADSSTFFVVMPIQRPISDSTIVKDSLKKFFGGSPTVVLQ